MEWSAHKCFIRSGPTTPLSGCFATHPFALLVTLTKRERLDSLFPIACRPIMRVHMAPHRGCLLLVLDCGHAMHACIDFVQYVANEQMVSKIPTSTSPLPMTKPHNSPWVVLSFDVVSQTNLPLFCHSILDFCELVDCMKLNSCIYPLVLGDQPVRYSNTRLASYCSNTKFKYTLSETTNKKMWSLLVLLMLGQTHGATLHDRQFINPRATTQTFLSSIDPDFCTLVWHSSMSISWSWSRNNIV